MRASLSILAVLVLHPPAVAAQVRDAGCDAGERRANFEDVDLSTWTLGAGGSYGGGDGVGARAEADLRLRYDRTFGWPWERRAYADEDGDGAPGSGGAVPATSAGEFGGATIPAARRASSVLGTRPRRCPTLFSAPPLAMAYWAGEAAMSFLIRDRAQLGLSLRTAVGLVTRLGDSFALQLGVIVGLSAFERAEPSGLAGNSENTVVGSFGGELGLWLGPARLVFRALANHDPTGGSAGEWWGSGSAGIVFPLTTWEFRTAGHLDVLAADAASAARTANDAAGDADEAATTAEARADRDPQLLSLATSARSSATAARAAARAAEESARAAAGATDEPARAAHTRRAEIHATAANAARDAAIASAEAVEAFAAAGD